MRRLVLALLVLPVVLAAEPNFSPPKVELLPFPETKGDSPALSLEAITEVAVGLESVLGGYPPRLKGPEDRANTYAKWSEAVQALDSFTETEKQSENVLVVQARLFRQGHNMDVSGCGERAQKVIKLALEKHPQSVPVNFQASYFYLQIDPKYAPEAEKALLRLRQLLGTKQNLEVERHLLFAYIHQEKVKDAKKQVDHCLSLAPNDSMFLKFREALKSGKIMRWSN